MFKIKSSQQLPATLAKPCLKLLFPCCTLNQEEGKPKSIQASFDLISELLHRPVCQSYLLVYVTQHIRWNQRRQLFVDSCWEFR